MIPKRLLLLVPAAVVFAAAVSGIAAEMNSNQEDTNNYSCARTSVQLSTDGDSNNVDIVVLVDGNSSTSISQQIVQSNARSEVDIDVAYGDRTLTISGETVENGNLVLKATRNGTVLNESIVVGSSDDRALMFRVDKNGELHVSRAENVGDDTESTEAGFDSDDSVYETDGGRNVDCSDSVPCTCSGSSTDISSPPRGSSAQHTSGVNVLGIVTRSNEFVGLEKPQWTTDCRSTGSEATADCPSET